MKPIKRTVGFLLALLLVCALLPCTAFAASPDLGVDTLDLTLYGHYVLTDGNHLEAGALNEYQALGATLNYLQRIGAINVETPDDSEGFGNRKIDLDRDGTNDINVTLEVGDRVYMKYTADPYSNLTGTYTLRLNEEDRYSLEEDRLASMYYSTVYIKFRPSSERDLGTKRMDLTGYGEEVIVDGPPHEMDEFILEDYYALKDTLFFLVNSSLVGYEEILDEGYAYGMERYDLDRDGHFDLCSSLSYGGHYTCLVFKVDPDTNLCGVYSVNLSKADKQYLDQRPYGSKYYSGLRLEFPTFVDVKPEKYFTKPVHWAFCHNPQITSGTDATHFSPNRNCTREQIVTFLWHAMRDPEPRTTQNPFTDVKENKYYYKAVLWAVENGITTGVSDTCFGVGVECKREQVVTFLWHTMNDQAPETSENPFTDVKEGKYYYNAVLWAVENGITSGVSANQFGVGRTCTRGQIVTFLYKLMVE